MSCTGNFFQNSFESDVDFYRAAAILRVWNEDDPTLGTGTFLTSQELLQWINSN
jgi:hypothetical protein